MRTDAEVLAIVNGYIYKYHILDVLRRREANRISGRRNEEPGQLFELRRLLERSGAEYRGRGKKPA